MSRYSPTSSSTRCASWPTSAPAPPAPRCRACSAARSTSPCPNALVAAARRGRRGRRRRPSRRSPASSLARRRRHGRASCCCSSRPTTPSTLCGMLGVEAGTEDGDLRAGRDRQHPRHLLHQRARRDDRHGARAARRRRRPPTCSARSSRPCSPSRADAGDVALMLDSELRVEGEDCSLSFLLLPEPRRRRRAARAPGRRGVMPSTRRWCAWASSRCRRRAGDVLVSLGLGSCIGLALVDRARGVAGLAHVVLPEATPARRPGRQVRRPRACPELVEPTTRARRRARRARGGARRRRADVLARRRRRRSTSAQRNEAAVRDAARGGAHPGGRHRPPAATRGRTIRVYVGARGHRARGRRRRNRDSCPE